jgi:hypothetical protein
VLFPANGLSGSSAAQPAATAIHPHLDVILPPSKRATTDRDQTPANSKLDWVHFVASIPSPQTVVWKLSYAKSCGALPSICEISGLAEHIGNDAAREGRAQRLCSGRVIFDKETRRKPLTNAPVAANSGKISAMEIESTFAVLILSLLLSQVEA